MSRAKRVRKARAAKRQIQRRQRLAMTAREVWDLAKEHSLVTITVKMSDSGRPFAIKMAIP